MYALHGGMDPQHWPRTSDTQIPASSRFNKLHPNEALVDSIDRTEGMVEREREELVANRLRGTAVP